MKFWTDCLNIFFPRRCFFCDNLLKYKPQELCFQCLMDLPLVDFGDLQNNVLHRQLNLSVEIDFCFAFLFYHHGGQAQELMRQFKYLKRPQVGVYFGLWMARLLHTYGLTESFDLIVPVPLSPKKKRQRGFNQAEVLAKQIAQISQVPLEVNWLKRKSASVRQVDRNREDRFNDLDRVDHEIFP